MKKFNYTSVLGVMLLLLLINGCKGDDIKLNTDIDNSRTYNWPFPVVSKFSFSIQDAIPEGALKVLNVDEEGMYNLKVSSNANIGWDDLAKIKDIEFRIPYLMSNQLKDGNELEIIQLLPLLMNEGARYDFAEILEGNLKIVIEIPAGYKGELEVRAPLFEPIISEVFYVTESAEVESYEFNFNTHGHTLEFSKDGEDTFIPVELVGQFDEIGNVLDVLIINYYYTDIEASSIHGYFGQRTVDLDDQTHKFEGINDLLRDANFKLRDISYTLKTENYIGVPFDIIASSLKFYTKQNNEEYKLLLLDGKSEVSTSVESSSFNGGDVIPSYAEKVIGSANSNILEVSNPLPEKVTANIYALANPKGEIPGEKNFLLGVDTLFAEFEIKAPLWIQLEEFNRKDTIAVDFRSILSNSKEYAEAVDLFVLYIDVENTLPFDIGLNILAVDEAGTVIGEILSDFENGFGAGEIVDGKVTKPGVSKIVAELTNEDALKYFDADVKSFLIKTKIASKDYETEYVKVLQQYGFDLKISFEVKLKIPNLSK